jgi:hypothetical protein
VGGSWIASPRGPRCWPGCLGLGARRGNPGAASQPRFSKAIITPGSVVDPHLSQTKEKSKHAAVAESAAIRPADRVSGGRAKQNQSQSRSFTSHFPYEPPASPRGSYPHTHPDPHCHMAHGTWAHGSGQRACQNQSQRPAAVRTGHAQIARHRASRHWLRMHIRIQMFYVFNCFCTAKMFSHRLGQTTPVNTPFAICTQALEFRQK